ncbi:hypothetical protein BDB00DRAFT_826710 [Zychaea mexicana]|uniref:uncharacterized protein n=1 Tax=Zychaea mexicana TaxID=64656 RepID=UPI0022FE0B84|nr:uncharacterized protein BDB00DRAFT_826710 [Zychaea mexicana]KAI9492671.1 hypothetical protein BDB00DRAFT_826710 [Zychaea mexicana]
MWKGATKSWVFKLTLLSFLLYSTLLHLQFTTITQGERFQADVHLISVSYIRTQNPSNERLCFNKSSDCCADALTGLGTMFVVVVE